MGNHIDVRGSRRQKVRESDPTSRRLRATFKQYLRDLEEDLLEEDLAAEDPDTPVETDQDE
jgi:Lon protease-like protein